MDKSLPFQEISVSNIEAIRTFYPDIDESELKWHWDEEDRIVELLEETDWQFQFDNELPQKIYTKIQIPAGKIHRVIKGNSILKVKITKIR